MRYVELFVILLIGTSALFLIIGLFRPWAMLWWEDEQNRMKVIKAYGSLTILFSLVYAGMKLFISE
ncbi:MAG TPA: hypothetical protein VG737_00605 [Cyclobacteriaceae bacterium]|nr:hypothetical protein [Cyclobacteriaceae bacterium]